jgi:CubicO group peptidase (beta-lactamase class C family)
MKKSFLLLITAFCLLSSHGQNKQTKQLAKNVDALLSGQLKQNEPGVAVLIAKNNNIVYKKAFGSADIELNVALQPDMVFRIGSITKQFTAIGILQLIEQHKLSLHDSIQQYIRDFPPKGTKITIETY